MQTLEGRTCVFAGATGAIGYGAVKAMCQAGMNVVMVTHDPSSASEIIASLEGTPGKCIAMSNKLSDTEIFAEVEKQFGSVDVIIVKTGSFNAVRPIEEITAAEVGDKLQHQIVGAYNMAHSALPYLKKSKAGRIIFCASAGAQDGFDGENIADSIARGATISMTYTFARSLLSSGTTVNCIAASGMINDHPPKSENDFDVASVADRIPIGHIGTADEFGAVVAYLASEEAGFVTGQVINLSGGIHIG